MPLKPTNELRLSLNIRWDNVHGIHESNWSALSTYTVNKWQQRVLYCQPATLITCGVSKIKSEVNTVFLYHNSSTVL